MRRGSQLHPPNPFERFHVVVDDEVREERRQADPEDEPPSPRTAFFVDDTQSLITKNESPDLSFEYSLNPYRGCEHGCAYCYARRYHEYLGWDAGLDFESKILVKPRAPALLRAEMEKPSWRPAKLACSGVTDCYQPIERRLRLTRGCLEVLAQFRNPVVIITKNYLITRDIDVLQELVRWRCGAALISLTTLDRELACRLEPRASLPQQRLRAIRALADAGVPVGVSLAPLIPGLNDHELPALMAAARDAGAQFATYSLVRLPGSVAPVFADWLDHHVSLTKKNTILRRIRDVHDGQLNDRRPGLRMSGSGARAEQVAQLFHVLSRKLGFAGRRPEVTTEHFRRVQQGQGELW